MNWERIMSLLPLIFQGVALAENVLTGGSGEDKKKLAAGVTVGLMGQFGFPVTQKSVALVSGSIDNVVEVLHASGAFEHSKSQEPAEKPEPVPATKSKKKPASK